MQKLLIADGSDDFRFALKEALRGKFEIEICGTGVTAEALMRSFQPEFLILDMSIPDLDGFSILQSALISGTRPKVIAIVDSESTYITKKLRQMNVEYILQKPCQLSVIAARILDIKKYLRPPVSFKEQQFLVGKHLRALNIPINLDGHQFLRIAVPLFYEDPEQRLGKELYAAISEMIGDTRPDSIERSIRSAVHAAWKTRNNEIWAQYFPSDANGQVVRPTNRTVISCLADKLAEEILF